MKNNIELLAPAGNIEIAKGVLKAGADAVYLAGNKFGARAYAANLTTEEILEIIDFAHLREKKVYLTINTLLKEQEIEKELYEFLLPFYKQGLDAVIVQDLGVIKFVHEKFPLLEIHGSTQLSIMSPYGAKLLKEYGVTRIVPAREVSLEEINFIKEQVNIEIESFIHGALCYSYSGQCLFSSFLGGRSGNRGRCAGPCRLDYQLLDEKKKPLTDKESVISLKDLSTLEILPKLMESGIDSFKIEGRMKSMEYACFVVYLYRKYMDLYSENPKKPYKVSKEDGNYLLGLGNRNGFTTGYYLQRNDVSIYSGKTANHTRNNEMNFQPELVEKKQKLIGKITLKQNQSLSLEIHYKDYVIYKEGGLVSKAKNQPLSKEQIMEKICKTGNTPYQFESLEIEMDEQSYCPVKDLNAVRREALESLENLVLTNLRRDYPLEIKEVIEEHTNENRNMLAVSVETREQLMVTVEKTYVDGIYLHLPMYDLREKSIFTKDLELCGKYHKKVYLKFPEVFRKRDIQYLEKNNYIFKEKMVDGFHVPNLDVLSFVLKYARQDQEIIAGPSLYTFNSYACGFLKEHKVNRQFASYELTKKELQRFENQDKALVIYGHIPFMITSGCLNKRYFGCNQEEKVLYLKDRMKKELPVKNYCKTCYNVIFNAVPLSLFNMKKEIEQLKISCVSIQFTKENPEEVQRVFEKFEKEYLNIHKDTYTLDQEEYTYGHFKNGVE